MNLPTQKLRQILRIDTEPSREDDSFDIDISNVSGSDLAKKFEDCRHRERCRCVIRPQGIPPELWDKFTRYIEASEQRRENWGIWQCPINTDTQPPTCGDHDDAIVKKITLVGSETTAESETEGWTTTGTVGGSLGTGGTNISGKTSAGERTAETTTNQQKQQFTCIVYECGTDDPDCRLNRRAFYQIGNKTFSTGSADRELQQEQFQAFLEDVIAEDSHDAADSVDDGTEPPRPSDDR